MTTDSETGPARIRQARIRQARIRQARSTASGRCVDLRPSQVSALDLYDQLDADGSALHAVCFMAVSGPLDRDLLWLTCDDARAAVAHVATRRFSLGDETALRVAVAQDSSYRQAIGGQAPAGGPPQPQILREVAEILDAL
jgi:hypothetical protein